MLSRSIPKANIQQNVMFFRRKTCLFVMYGKLKIVTLIFCLSGSAVQSLLQFLFSSIANVIWALRPVPRVGRPGAPSAWRPPDRCWKLGCRQTASSRCRMSGPSSKFRVWAYYFNNTYVWHEIHSFFGFFLEIFILRLYKKRSLVITVTFHFNNIICLFLLLCFSLFHISLL